MSEGFDYDRQPFASVKQFGVWAATVGLVGLFLWLLIVSAIVAGARVVFFRPDPPSSTPQ